MYCSSQDFTKKRKVNSLLYPPPPKKTPQKNETKLIISLGLHLEKT